MKFITKMVKKKALTLRFEYLDPAERKLKGLYIGQRKDHIEWGKILKLGLCHMKWIIYSILQIFASSFLLTNSEKPGFRSRVRSIDSSGPGVDQWIHFYMSALSLVILTNITGCNIPLLQLITPMVKHIALWCWVSSLAINPLGGTWMIDVSALH